MRLALILSDYGERMRDLQRNLSAEFSVIVGRSVRESFDLLQTLPVDLVLVDLDSDSARAEELPERIREFRPHCTVVGILPPDGECDGIGRACDASLRADSTPYEISMALDRVMERQRLLEELEQQRAEIRRLQARSERLQAERAPAQPVDKILKAFSRALSSGFDQERLLNLYVDTVFEMMRVSKVSVLLHDSELGAYRVRCYRGLRPDVAEGLTLRPTGGLAAWLAREGRIMSRDLAESSGIPPDVRKEMDALQAVVSIPMLCSGMLVGVLSLNSRVTGSALLEDDLETLFTLSSHMAVALQDVGILAQMRRQKVYIEQILDQMSAGVVTISEGEQVATINRKAVEILGRPAEDLLGRDLRRLPSPLGDLLFETMRTGRRYQAEEVLLLPARTPLVVHTYRLEGPDGGVLGSAAVLDVARPRAVPDVADPSAERLSLLGPALDRLASNVNEPATRISDLSERIAGDPTAAPGCQEIGRAILREARSLQVMASRLSLLGGRPEYHFEPQKLDDVVARGLAQAHAEGLPGDAAVLGDGANGRSARVRGDVEHLSQAVSCLIAYAAEQAGGAAPVAVNIEGPDGWGEGPKEADQTGIRISYRGPASREIAAAPWDAVRILDLESGRPPELHLSAGRRVIEDHGGTVGINAGPDGRVNIDIRLPAEAAPRETLLSASKS